MRSLVVACLLAALLALGSRASPVGLMRVQSEPANGSDWILIGADASVFHVDVGNMSYSRLGRFSWNNTHGNKLVLTGPLRAFDPAAQVVFVVVASPPPFAASRVVAVELPDPAAPSLTRDHQTLASRESEVFDFVVTGIHFCVLNGSLTIVAQSTDRVSVATMDPSSLEVTGTVWVSPPGVGSLGVSAFDQDTQVITLQVLDGFAKYMLTVAVPSGAASKPVGLPCRFLGLEYSNATGSVLGVIDSLYSPVLVFAIDPVSGKLSEPQKVAARGGLFPPAVGLDPVAAVFAFTVFSGDSSESSAVLQLVDVAALPFAPLKRIDVPADATVIFALDAAI